MKRSVIMKTIIIGLGNPILGDDGVGWKVVEEIKRHLPAGEFVDVEFLSLGGIGLMEHLIGYDRAILVDSFIADAEDVGSILIRKLNDLPNYSAFHITSAHDTSLQNAIQLGREMGAYLPEEVIVIGIAIQKIHDFGEELSTMVQETVLPAAHIVLNFLKERVTN
jgi:hydrogenase maturation protease